MNDEWHDRLMDSLLREELGGDAPPDLTDRVVDRVFPRSTFSWARRVVRLTAVAASIALVVGLGWWYLGRIEWEQSYPVPAIAGEFELDGELGRGAIIHTDSGTATLNLGGYASVNIRPASYVRLEGNRYAEALYLEEGEVACKVEREVGAFSINTSMGTVSVKGTEFIVRVSVSEGEKMIEKHVFVRVLAGAVLFTGLGGPVVLNSGQERAFAAEEKKKKGGTVVGVITEKGKNHISVKAEGELKARRYVPHWRGGLPANGGGLDKKMLAIIRELKVGTRVRLVWEFEERPRVVKVEVLKREKK